MLLKKLPVKIASAIIVGSMMVVSASNYTFAADETKAPTEETSEVKEEEKTEEESEETAEVSETEEDLSEIEAENIEVETTDTNTDEAQENENPVQSPTPAVETPESEAESGKSEVEEKRWDISIGQPRTRAFQMAVPAYTVRLEVFYSAQEPAPIIEFTSASGYVYSSQTDTIADGDTLFLTRRNLEVTDYSDIRYMVIYISEPRDPGKWQMNVTMDKNTKELFIAQTNVPEGWKDLKQDYKTSPTGIVTWAIDEELSPYTASDILKIIKKDETIPKINQIEAAEPIVEEPIDPLIIICVCVVILIFALTAFIIYTLYKSKTKETERKKGVITKANSKLRQKRKKENDNLDNILDEFADEYDDKDIDSYFESEESNDLKDEESKKEPMVPSWAKTDATIEPEQPAILEQENRNEPVREIPVQEEDEPAPPPWMPQPEKKVPSWMVDNEGESGGFF